jgi:hypothetical protein
MPGKARLQRAGATFASRMTPRAYQGVPKVLSAGEETFALQCKAYDLRPEREYRFSERKFKFDFAWPEFMVAVEVEGGTEWGRSRHSKGKGFEADCEKYNLAAILGWKVLRFSTRMVVSGEAIDLVRKLLQGTAS